MCNARLRRVRAITVTVEEQ